MGVLSTLLLLATAGAGGCRDRVIGGFLIPAEGPERALPTTRPQEPAVRIPECDAYFEMSSRYRTCFAKPAGKPPDFYSAPATPEQASAMAAACVHALGALEAQATSIGCALRPPAGPTPGSRLQRAPATPSPLP